ncbi:O-acetyl-ADP-ribose deacetylase [Endozoicomonas lisbonensis]|uniref:O-acetyl-ADP-ribose deacetylase (Regulator of RNase III) n=1 Tax=Endozoicomonas lisbonensis TaxID=3120522 RepID=A0ABV2SD29_9GAMM
MIKGRIKVVQGDITKIAVDGIVNAANSRLAGGGGVDGAIHRAAGAAQLQQACREYDGCPTGQVRVTPAFNLPAKKILHTVGPVWQGGEAGETELLRSCYQKTLELADQEQLTSIAFPAISCGVYGYPYEEAAHIAITTVVEWLKESACPEEVVFVLFDQAMTDIYRRLLHEIVQRQPDCKD